MDSYTYSVKNNLLSFDQRKVLLVLIPKGTTDKREQTLGVLYLY